MNNSVEKTEGHNGTISRTHVPFTINLKGGMGMGPNNVMSMLIMLFLYPFTETKGDTGIELHKKLTGWQC